MNRWKICRHYGQIIPGDEQRIHATSSQRPKQIIIRYIIYNSMNTTATTCTTTNRLRIGLFTALTILSFVLVPVFFNDLTPYSYNRRRSSYFGLLQKQRSVDLSLSSNKNRTPGVDIIIAGYPKCGTTTLLKIMVEHPEIDMVEYEVCGRILHGKDSIEIMQGAIDELFQSFQSSDNNNIQEQKRYSAVKCPNIVQNVAPVLPLLEALNPDMKVVIGLRHPVLYFESHYNYKATHLQNFAPNETSPDPYQLIGGIDHSWLNVYSDFARFEQTLVQFGKVDYNSTTDSEFLSHFPNSLSNKHFNVINSSFPIFLYEISQLSDANEDRAELFRNDLQRFLGLSTAFPPIVPHNVNHKKDLHPNALHICDEKYRALRQTLISRSVPTRRWIRDKFMKSDQVIVGGGDNGGHFLELMRQWSQDPCED